MKDRYTINGKEIIIGKNQVLLENINEVFDFKPKEKKTKGGIYIPDEVNRKNSMRYATKTFYGIVRAMNVVDKSDHKKYKIDFDVGDIVLLMHHNVVLVAENVEIGDASIGDLILTPVESILGKVNMTEEDLKKSIEERKKADLETMKIKSKIFEPFAYYRVKCECMNKKGEKDKTFILKVFEDENGYFITGNCDRCGYEINQQVKDLYKVLEMMDAKKLTDAEVALYLNTVIDKKKKNFETLAKDNKKVKFSQEYKI